MFYLLCTVYIPDSKGTEIMNTDYETQELSSRIKYFFWLTVQNMQFP